MGTDSNGNNNTKGGGDVSNGRSSKPGGGDNKCQDDLDDDQQPSFEQILDLVGTKGRWNYMMFALCSLCAFVAPLQALSYQFLGATPDHWCQVEELKTANWTAEQIISFAIPYKNTSTDLQSCTMYQYNYSSAAALGYKESMRRKDNLLLQGSETKKCKERDFNHTQYKNTVVTKWDLVCERRALYSTTQSIYQVGKLVGSIIFGYLLDVFGRRRIIVISVGLYISFSLMAAAAPSLTLYMLLKFFISLFEAGVYIGCYIFALELCSPFQRSIVGNLFAVPWAIGYMAIPGIAIIFPQWQWMQVAFTALTLILLSYYWLLPDSPRWLILQGRYEESLEVLQKAADMNKRILPSHDAIKQAMIAIKEQDEQNQVKQPKDNLLDSFFYFMWRSGSLVRTPEMCFRTLIVFFCWFAASMIYYGISLNATNIRGIFTLSIHKLLIGNLANEYLYMFLGGILELPSYILLWPAVVFCGRKKTFVLLYFLSGLSIALSVVLTFAIDDAPASGKIFLSLLGKLTITAAFQLAYLYTAELFPTQQRSLAMGGAVLTSRLGSICSPYIVDLMGASQSWAPAAVFSCISFVAAILAATLPETTNLILPESIDAVEARGFWKKSWKERRESENQGHRTSKVRVPKPIIRNSSNKNVSENLPPRRISMSVSSPALNTLDSIPSKDEVSLPARSRPQSTSSSDSDSESSKGFYIGSEVFEKDKINENRHEATHNEAKDNFGFDASDSFLKEELKNTKDNDGSNNIKSEFLYC